MARKTTISREGLEFLIGSVKNTINIGDIINNEDLADNKTYSNIKIEERIDDKIDEKLANFDGDVDLTDVDNRITTLETQVSDLFQSVSDGKTLVANAITDKGVSTATNATFATMASNISNITTSTYKEETKSYNNTSSGTTRLTFTFSADVSGVKQITQPSSNLSSYIVPETVTSMFTINGKELILYVNGAGTWKVTAFIK